jgi:predicted nucleic acid-binding protein
MVLFDTPILIDMLHGTVSTERFLRLRARGEVPVTTALNAAEIFHGINPADHERARLLFGGVRVVPVGLEDAERASLWRNEFATRGISLSSTDCMIAAVAVNLNIRLATTTPQLFPMDGVEIEAW